MTFKSTHTKQICYILFIFLQSMLYAISHCIPLSYLFPLNRIPFTSSLFHIPACMYLLVHLESFALMYQIFQESNFCLWLSFFVRIIFKRRTLLLAFRLYLAYSCHLKWISKEWKNNLTFMSTFLTVYILQRNSKVLQFTFLFF